MKIVCDGLNLEMQMIFDLKKRHSLNGFFI